jgi:CO/xanthine dehydrogenase FAD-binding subunit
MRELGYAAPSNLSEALRLLDTQSDARVLAGGTDLVVQLRNRGVAAGFLVDLKRIDGLAGIRREPGFMNIGALTTLSEIVSSPDLGDLIPLLVEAAGTVGSVQIRNRATIGGNICRAAPSGDLPPSLLVLDAKFVVVSHEGERTIACEQFFRGPGQTALERHEMLKEIRVPILPGSASVYLKHGRRKSVDLATVGVAVLVIAENGTCKAARIALASVAPVPFRAGRAEERLHGERLTESLVEEAAGLAAEESRPITDIYGSAWYKRHLVLVLVRRALTEARRRLEATS